MFPEIPGGHQVTLILTAWRPFEPPSKVREYLEKLLQGYCVSYFPLSCIPYTYTTCFLAEPASTRLTRSATKGLSGTSAVATDPAAARAREPTTRQALFSSSAAPAAPASTSATPPAAPARAASAAAAPPVVEDSETNTIGGPPADALMEEPLDEWEEARTRWCQLTGQKVYPKWKDLQFPALWLTTAESEPNIRHGVEQNRDVGDLVQVWLDDEDHTKFTIGVLCLADKDHDTVIVSHSPLGDFPFALLEGSKLVYLEVHQSRVTAFGKLANDTIGQRFYGGSDCFFAGSTIETRTSLYMGMNIVAEGGQTRKDVNFGSLVRVCRPHEASWSKNVWVVVCCISHPDGSISVLICDKEEVTAVAAPYEAENLKMKVRNPWESIALAHPPKANPSYVHQSSS